MILVARSIVEDSPPAGNPPTRCRRSSVLDVPSPLVLLEICSILKSSLVSFAAELVLGAAAVRLPGEMTSPTSRRVIEDVTNLLHCFRQLIRPPSLVPSGPSVFESYHEKDVKNVHGEQHYQQQQQLQLQQQQEQQHPQQPQDRNRRHHQQQQQHQRQGQREEE
ncbi:hypothetical protein SprV_0602195900 [Sparganum proliferum]